MTKANSSVLLSRYAIVQGELAALIAPSGAGKSILLMMIGCVLEPTSGKIWLGNELVYDQEWKTKDARKIRREKIGFIFQAHYLIPFLNVLDNVALLPLSTTKDENSALKRSKEILGFLGLSEKLSAKPSELSGGQNQRVAIAQALANQPQIILADGPTAALDIERAHSVVKMLNEIAKLQDVAIIMVTHDKRLLGYCDKILKIVEGKVETTQVNESEVV
ncbi:MAG: ATP-binding cassette domain-containing protein [Porticoccus sp.]|nr:ATP-binding cassette domain-containing protein [Porticoccus sp.]